MNETINPVTVTRVLQVARDFNAHGGSSLELLAWELGLEPVDVAAAWSEAIDQSLLQAAAPVRAPEHDVDLPSGEQMWRLSEAGWAHLGVDSRIDHERSELVSRLRILERLSDPSLHALARLTAYILGAHASAVHIFDDQYMHRIAAVNAPLGAEAAHNSFCRQAVDADSAIITADAAADGRFTYSTYAQGETPVRFFASAPLRTSVDGMVVGTLCAFDSQPKEITEEQRRLLGDLADLAVSHIEFTRVTFDQHASGIEMAAAGE